MLKREEILFVVLKDLRANYQQIIYLLQELGLNLGYRFQWSISGVYSPDLRYAYEDMMDMNEGIKERLDRCKVNKSSQLIVDRFNKIDSSLVGVIAQISFLEKYAFIPIDKYINDYLLEKFTQTEIDKGYKIYNMYMINKNDPAEI